MPRGSHIFLTHTDDASIINIINKLDCIDMEKSIYKRCKGDPEAILKYEKLYFLPEKIGSEKLFRPYHLDTGYFFCTDEFKQSVEKNGIKGVVFDLYEEIEGY